MMQLKWILSAGAAVAAIGVGAAVASHVTEVDPATVPTGFLAAHNSIDRVPVSKIARAAQGNGVDAFVQHARLGPNEATGWHTHPGPVVVTVVKGSLTYEDAKHGVCRQRTYEAGTGFTDPGFGHVHRAIAGPEGVDFYPVYLLPRGSETHLILATAPAACAS
jgi:hypothetical protein